VGVTGDADFAKVAANAVTNVIQDRIEDELRRQVPVPIPNLPF